MMESIRVLIVEDNDIDAELLIRELRRAGFTPDWKRVETAADFVLALELSPQLILSDFSMPKFDGLQALALLQASGRDIPFILVSGTVGEELAVESMRRGVTDYLLKDRLGRLGSAVQRALDESRLRRERGDIEDRLSASQAMLRIQDRAIQVLGQGIVISDASLFDCPIIFVNRGFESITGYTAAETIGRGLRFLQDRRCKDSATTVVDDAIREESSSESEFLSYRKDGTAFWNKLTVVPIRDETDKVTHFVAVQTDITSRRDTEEQLRQSQKMEAVGQLAGGVAHDFNNMLTVIDGYTSMLLDGLETTDKTWVYLQEIKMASALAAGLTRQLLSFSRRQVRKPETLEFNDVIVETATLLKRLIGANIELEMSLAPEVKCVCVDRGQISQLLLNLAINSRDAMGGRGRLSICTENVILDEPKIGTGFRLEPGEYVLLSVSDNGCGMAPNMIERIFEPFFTTKPLGRGTGLGLATVYGIVNQSEGCIEVLSEVGVGTTFLVHFPISTLPSTSPAKSGEANAAVNGSELILLVEDDSALRDMISTVLTGHGYEVITAKDGYEAIDIFSKYVDTVRLVITDMVMPGLSGEELATRVSALKPDIRIVLMSGYVADHELRDRILRRDVDFLQKPFSMRDLAIKIRQSLDVNSSNDESVMRESRE